MFLKIQTCKFFSKARFCIRKVKLLYEEFRLFNWRIHWQILRKIKNSLRFAISLVLIIHKLQRSNQEAASTQAEEWSLMQRWTWKQSKSHNFPVRSPLQKWEIDPTWEGREAQAHKPSNSNKRTNQRNQRMNAVRQLLLNPTHLSSSTACQLSQLAITKTHLKWLTKLRHL